MRLFNYLHYVAQFFPYKERNYGVRQKLNTIIQPLTSLRLFPYPIHTEHAGQAPCLKSVEVEGHVHIWSLLNMHVTFELLTPGKTTNRIRKQVG